MRQADTAPADDHPNAAGRAASTARLMTLATWIPPVTAGGYLLLLFSQVRRLLTDYYHWYPDFVWAPILARDLAANGSGGLINMGEAAHYSSIWFLMLTRDLPFNRAIWQFSPLFFTLMGVLLMAWAARRVAGSWAGLMTLAIGVGAGPAILATTITTGMRSHTWFAIGATAALLIYFASRAEEGRVWTRIGVGGVAAVFAGVTVASDPLFVVSGLAPLVGAVTLGWLLIRTDKTRNLALGGWVVAALGIGIGLAINRVMHDLGYRKTLIAEGYTFVTLDEFLSAAGGFVRDILTLTNGNFFGRPVSLLSLASLGMAVLTVGALFVSFVVLKPTLTRVGTQVNQTPRTVYVSYWVLVQLATAVAYLLSPISSTVGQSLTSRYLVPVFYAISAIVPVWAAGSFTWRKLSVAGAATALCLLSAAELMSLPAASPEPIRTAAPQIATFLQEEGLERGYGSYRLAHPFTHNVDMAHRTYPVFECRPPSPELCPFPVNTRSVWYEPEEGVRTFLITDPDAGFLALSSPPSQALGEPSRQRRFGSLLVLVYEYDIASRFAAPAGGR